MSSSTHVGGQQAAGLPLDEIVRIAHADAIRAYHDLAGYRISIVHESDGWHIDYELKDLNLNGGGPHYVIDAESGAILSKRYEQ